MHRLHALRELLHHLPRLREGQRLALELIGWALAVLWCIRTRTLMQRLREVPDISTDTWDLCPTRAPGLVVVVPARDEAKTLVPAMETLLAQEYPWMRIVAVDDRSRDDTGALLEVVAAKHPERLGVIHLSEEPEGWIAKTFAMETAAIRSRSDWLLFTDANVWFSPSLVRRALAYAEVSEADHMVVVPSPVTKSWRERFFLAFLSVIAIWATRPWRVADPLAPWDAVGAGAFNLIRREAWEELGGFAPQRLAVIEDLTLGRRVRAARMRQRLVFAPGLLPLHGASGIRGVVRGLSKNLFAAVNFRLLPAAFFAVFVITIFLLPVPALFWPTTTLPGLVILGCVAVQYRELGEVTGMGGRWVLLYPLAALLLLWAMFHSVVVTLWRGSVRWRDTSYPLRELRRHNNPLAWEWEEAVQRTDRRRAQRRQRPGLLLRGLLRMQQRGRAARRR